jgi:hypothetical protein
MIFCSLLAISLSVKGQESEVIVRYSFTNKSSPPMKEFYMKIFVDGIFVDSTKPHTPSSDLLGDVVRRKVAIGPHAIRMDGYVKEGKKEKVFVSKVMGWEGNFNVTKRKCRIGIRLNSNYEVEVWTTPDF